MDTRGTRDVDEMELVLSLDGGATFPLRVSRGLEPVAQTVRWTVPNLPTSRARLALRQGRCRRHDSEEVTIVGPAFAISGNAGEPLERVFRVGDEWRTREALESREDPPLANLSAAQGDEFRGILPSDCNAERTEFSATSTLDERERVRLASTVQVKRAVDRFLLASTGPLRQ
jgi:hypothetical protein